MRQSNQGMIVLRAMAGSQPEQSQKPALTVYYDGSCPLCSAEINHYSSLSGGDRVDFVDASSPDTELGLDLNREQAMSRFHIRNSDGKIVSGAGAFVALWEVLPRWKWAARLASSMPGAIPLLECVYRLFLLFRPSVSRLFGLVAGHPASNENSRC
jgi:predicted DCC family thiol-disulfide oxidoreductase YuxK